MRTTRAQVGAASASDAGRIEGSYKILQTRIRAVTAQLELSKPAPQTVLNNQYSRSTNRRNEPSCFTALRLFVSRGAAHHSLNSPSCSCVSITVPAVS